MRIKLINKTTYSSRDLRAFLRVGFQAYSTRVNKIVVVRYQRSNSGVSGRGSLGRNSVEARRIWLHVPRDPKKFNVGDLAHTLYHELLHNRGARHRDMTHEQRYWNGVPAPWCVGLTIGLEPKKPSVLREERLATLVEKREEHARKMLTRAQKKQKLANAAVRRWATKVRYYERVAAKKEKA